MGGAEPRAGQYAGEPGGRLFRRVSVGEAVCEGAVGLAGSYVKAFLYIRRRMSLLIIANPVSGKGVFEKLRPEIEVHLRQRNVEFEIWSWDKVEEMDEMMARAQAMGFQKIIAAGGDGTVHHVGKRLIGTDVLFGVMPIGTGNGIANHFHIPKRVRSCLDVYLEPATVRMDTGLMNDEPFLGFVGIGGYDAYTAHRFAGIKKRSFTGYIKIALDSYQAVAPQTYKVTVHPPEGAPYTYTDRHTAFSSLNVSQFGNGMTPAPGERVDDGVFSLCTLVHAPAWYIPVFSFKMFTRTIGEGDRYGKRKRAVKVILEREAESIAQIDGEPAYAPAKVEIKLRPQSLTFMVPPGVKDRV